VPVGLLGDTGVSKITVRLDRPSRELRVRTRSIRLRNCDPPRRWFGCQNDGRKALNKARDSEEKTSRPIARLL